MAKELVLKKGNIVKVAQEYKQRKRMQEYLDYVNDLLEFKEELDEYKKGIKEVEKYVNNLIDKLNNLKISKDELGDNFVSFIKQYSVGSWKKVMKDIK